MKLPNVISLLLLVLLGANYFGCLSDLDWSWQVRTGQRIVESGCLRTHDAFSYTLDGKLLHDFEWLWEVLLWYTWDFLGLGGLKLLRVILVSTPLVLLGWRLHRDGIRWHVIVLALVSAFFVVAPAWNLRPLYCTTIGLFLAWSMLHDHCTGRQQLTWWALPLVMLLWANMHPGVITGQALLIGAVASEWLLFLVMRRRTALPVNPNFEYRDSKQIRNPKSETHWSKRLLWDCGFSDLFRISCFGFRDLSKRSLVRFTIIAGAAFAATFVSPDPLERLLYPFAADLKHPIFRIFVEMQPLHRFLFHEPFVAPVVYAVAALVLVTIVKRFRHYRLWELALLAGLAFLGSVAVRSLMDWYLVMLALGLPQITALYVEAVKRRPRPGWLAGLLRIDNGLRRLFASRAFRWQPAWPIAGAAALLAITLLAPGARAMPLRDAPEWPVAALDYIEAADLGGNFFAPPDYGAYIGWRLKERARTYMDTRGFFFPPALVEDSHYVPALGPDWQRRLERVLNDYPTQYFLLETWGARGALWRALRPHVADPLYEDAQAVLLTAAQVREGIARLDGQVAAR